MIRNANSTAIERGAAPRVGGVLARTRIIWDPQKNEVGRAGMPPKRKVALFQRLDGEVDGWPFLSTMTAKSTSLALRLRGSRMLDGRSS